MRLPVDWIAVAITSDAGAQDLDPGPEGGRSATLVAASGEHEGSIPPRKLREFLSRARLPDPRLTHEQRQTPGAVPGRLERRLEPRELPFTTDERMIEVREWPLVHAPEGLGL